MEPTANNPMNDQQFDALLRHALLNDETLLNDKNLEQMATHVLSPDAGETPVPENDLVSRLTKDLAKNKFNWKLNLLVLAGILSIATLVFLFRKTDNAAVLPGNDSANKAVLLAMNEKNKAQTEALVNSNPLPVTNPAIFLLNDSTDDLTHSDIAPVHGEQHFVYTGMNIKDDMLHYEMVPALTDGQIAQTKIDKLKMMKEIAKKKTYANLGPGKTSVNGEMIHVDGFSIANAEVSNLEYRTFLNDLVIQGKYDDYLLAMPVAGEWKSAGIPEFENIYFENTAYNSFPVVNITRVGAGLYCTWLTESMKAAINAKEVKWSGNDLPDFRLPSNVEWIYAARGCDSTAMKFPWGHVVPDSVQNKNGCFLCNFNYDSSRAYFANKHICDGYKKLNQGGFHHAIITTAGLAIDTLLTCPVYSYNPNAIGQYNMLGDVSEMVWTYVKGSSEHGEARAMGGNWKSYITDVLIESPQQYVGVTSASPLIGFRPVMNGHYNYNMIKQVKL